jgi:CDP-diacylglycerol--glycerol-3-phosphate 3-phosphatidyltransferase
MFNLANNLTVPFLVVLLYFPGRGVCVLAMLLFVLASLTDLFDGLIARRYNLVTTMGKFLDPLADKLLIVSVLVMLAWLHWLPAWMAVVVICRELTVTGLRAIAVEQGTVIAADRFGKLKTIVQIVALCPLLLHYTWWGFDPQPLGMGLMWAAVVLTVFSGANYLRNFFKSMRESGQLGAA